ncbi:HDL039Cp [Eremothecium sinecaudum]|uniref:HDL039Cp n=1 Tax=Eremothecium sinecaudum TaxID=45286 RepID=A0A0X8HSM7_9SACH|nr:HDL039Cp [Eremothecium sinecaudum]AMD20705.1 HDL039Cp [Eremothecium sinecaudum]
MPEISDKLVFQSGEKTLLGLLSDKNCLFVVNKNQLTKVLYLDQPHNEPEILETCQSPTSVFAYEDSYILVTSINGDVYQYSKGGKTELLFRSALPLRDCVAIHAGKTCVVGGDDLELTFIDLNVGHKKDTIRLNEQLSQMSYNSQMNILTVTLVDGTIVFYSLTSETPNEVKRLEGYIEKNFYNDIGLNEEGTAEYCDENRLCTRVSWHPRGLQFAIPSKDGTVKIFNLSDFSLIKTLALQAKSYFTSLLFEPIQGRYIAATDLSNRLTIWDTISGKVYYSKDLSYKLTNIIWNAKGSSLELLLGTWTGEVVTVKGIAELDAFSADKNDSLENELPKSKKNALFLDSDDDELGTPLPSQYNENDTKLDLNSENVFTDNEDQEENSKREYNYGDDEQFIDDDDDDGGYVTKKPKIGPVASLSSTVRISKNQPQSRFHYKPISPGGTPFGSADKRYLTMSNLGFVWTVKSASGQFTITVSFFDVGRFREYHFEDLFGYDVCSLSEDGTFFAQSKSGDIFYRPHDSFSHSKWTKKIPLAPSERITSIAATPKKVVVATSLGYIRMFNVFGIPMSLEKMSPVVAIAAYEYRIFAVHYSPYHGILYSLFEQSTENGGKYYQKECPLPISLQLFNGQSDQQISYTFSEFNPLGIKSLFFSSFGDPCIFGYDNVLLVLSKWRNPMESRWIPLVDSQLELWMLSGGKNPTDVHVWPLGLNYDTMNYILIKGKHFWPEFPLPLPSEMEIRIPLLDKDQLVKNEKENNNEQEEVVVPVTIAAEEEYLRSKILVELLTDTIENDGELYGNENEILQSLFGAHDRSLLRLFAAACSNQDSDKALSLVKELKQDKALTAATKIAQRAELLMLVKKVAEIRDARYELQLART